MNILCLWTNFLIIYYKEQSSIFSMEHLIESIEMQFVLSKIIQTRKNSICSTMNENSCTGFGFGVTSNDFYSKLSPSELVLWKC